jgi:hypothetical protein
LARPTHESAAGFAAFGKGDFTLLTSQDRAMDSTDPRRPADRALKETDRTKRAKMYQDLQQLFMSGAPSAVPVGWVVTGVPAVGGYPAALNDGVTALA